MFMNIGGEARRRIEIAAAKHEAEWAKREAERSRLAKEQSEAARAKRRQTQRVLKLEAVQKEAPKYMSVINEVCDLYGVQTDDIFRTRTGRSVADCRDAIFYELHETHRMTFREIGRRLGFDREMISRSCRRYKALIDHWVERSRLLHLNNDAET